MPPGSPSCPWRSSCVTACRYARSILARFRGMFFRAPFWFSPQESTRSSSSDSSFFSWGVRRRFTSPIIALASVARSQLPAVRYGIEGGWGLESARECAAEFDGRVLFDKI